MCVQSVILKGGLCVCLVDVIVSGDKGIVSPPSEGLRPVWNQFISNQLKSVLPALKLLAGLPVFLQIFRFIVFKSFTSRKCTIIYYFKPLYEVKTKTTKLFENILL